MSPGLAWDQKKAPPQQSLWSSVNIGTKNSLTNSFYVILSVYYAIKRVKLPPKCNEQPIVHLPRICRQKDQLEIPTVLYEVWWIRFGKYFKFETKKEKENIRRKIRNI